MASLPYGSVTVNNVANKRDGRSYQEPIGDSTTEVVGQNELFNGCIGTSAEQVIEASFATDLNYSQIALGTKAIGNNAAGVESVGYWCQSASAAAAGATGAINTTTWTWTAGAGSDTILATVAVGDRAWAGVLVL